MPDLVEALDLRTMLKPLYSAPAKAPVLIDVPAMSFLMIDGIGDPNVAPAFQAAVEALYSVAYTLKFAFKKSAHPIDYPVMPLEGLWWADDMAVFGSGNRDAWRWTLMIMQPEIVDAGRVATTLTEVASKKPNPALDLLRFERFAEGKSAQLMHVGPFSTEPPNIQRLHDFIAAQGLKRSGKHHEIYLSDMRRTAPEKLKTILRQPVKAA